MGGCLYRACKSVYKGGQVKDVVFQPFTLSTEVRGVHAHIDGGRVLSGRGAACGTQQVYPEGLYFEIKVRHAGSFAAGIIYPPTNASKELDGEVCDNKTSFGIRSDILAANPLVGDIIGVYVEMTNGVPHLSFALNGLPLSDLYDVPKPGTSLKIKPGTFFPVVYVNKGAMLEVAFEENQWKYPPDCEQPEDPQMIVTT